MEGTMFNFDFGSTTVYFSVISIIALLIYLAIIAFIIIFIVKAVKYFMRIEMLLKEINGKLGSEHALSDSASRKNSEGTE
jgi:hypothetical protein